MASERWTETLKRYAALQSTYGRALRLARGGSVLAASETEGGFGSTVGLVGRVAASDGGYYSVGVDLDLDACDVLDYSCTCPASTNYGGMCKHEIALALSYLGVDDAAPERPLATGGPQRVAELPSSASVSELLHGASERRLLEATARRERRRADSGPAPRASLAVSLVHPSRAFDADSLALKLTVRRGSASYIVKNVSEIVHAWRRGSEISYGKKLAFAHTRDAFDERSAQLLDLVGRIVDTQHALYVSRWDYVGGGRGTDIKELPLSDADVCDVLDVMQGCEVTLDVCRRYADRWGCRTGTVLSSLRVGEGDPKIACAIEPSPAGGYDISLPNDLRFFASGKKCYVLDGDALLRTSEAFAVEAAPVLGAFCASSSAPHVSEADVSEFCRSLLSVLRTWTELDVPPSIEGLEPPEAVFSFRIGMEDGSVSCEAEVSYGDWSVPLGTGDSVPGQPARDLASEYHAIDVLEDYFPLVGGAYSFDDADDELLFRLLTDGLAELGELGEVLLSEQLRGIKVRTSPNLSVSAKVGSGLLDVELGASGLTQRELMDYLEGFKRKQRYVRLSTGDIVRIGENLQTAASLADGLGVDIDELAAGGVGLPSARALLVDALLQNAQSVRLVRDSGFRKLVRDFDSYSDADIEVPSGLQAELRGYQEDGFRWLGTLERMGFGGVLADDMGLGKTLQVIAHVLGRKEEGATGCSLIVCPASLVYNWMSELARFAPGLRCVAAVGTKASRAASIGSSAELDVLVTSYDLLRRDVEIYSGQHFARVVLDEAQYIKNPRAQVTKCAKCLDADARFALTGTPIENRLAELWSIFDFLMPGYLGSREEFAKRYESPVEAREHDASTLLRCAIGPFVLRRLKSEVLADLPDKTESVVYAQMEPKQRKLYLASQDRLALQIQHQEDKELKGEKLKILAELTKLRQICCDPSLCFEGYDGSSAKLETCMELVSQAIDGGHRVLLFSQFTSMLDIIERRLSSEGFSTLMLTGSTSKEARERLVRRFQAGGGDVFLISLKAGGVGLNLTSADVVIHYDPWWNTAAQDQATDRAHRIGQRHDVSVFKLIVEGTIEERILKMQEAKRDLAESVLAGEGVKSALLTREDILALLGSS